MCTEFRRPSNENSNIKKLKKSTKGLVYAAEFRKGSCILNFVYRQMSSVLKIIQKITAFKELTP